jgi:DNA end-binding protein Ku
MLMLELMYFPDELIDVAEFNAPVENAVGKAEMQMAKQLIESMTSEWKPEQYTDLYHEVLEKIVEEKIERGGNGPPVRVKRQTPTNVVDLLSALQRSIQHTQAKEGCHQDPSDASEEGRVDGENAKVRPN